MPSVIIVDRPLIPSRSRVRTFTLICLILTIVYLVADALSTRWEQRRHSHADVVVPSEDATIPDVGFDLTESYGTATALLNDGTYIHVGPIEGDENYKSTMHRLSLKSSRHMAPPYDWWQDGGALAGQGDILREFWRSTRKRVGLPASRDVGALSRMMNLLRKATEAALGEDQVVKEVAVTSPDLFALYDEDLYDAAEYLGLGDDAPSEGYFRARLVNDKTFRRQPKHADAVFVAYNIEEGLPPGTRNHLLSMSFSRRALSAEFRLDKISARTDMLHGQQHESYYDDELGFDALRNMEPMEKDLFWLKVQYRIEEWIIKGGNNHKFTDVSLLGESAYDQTFQKVLFKAIENRMGQREGDFVVHSELDPTFVASKGAAEMAKRILEARAYVQSPEEYEDDEGGCEL